VCETKSVPTNTIERDDGWKCFRIQGVLDFSLIGILAKISRLLAENEIGIFAVSTYNTDYILVKEDNYDKALKALAKAGYDIV
ncbi:MAG: ACT domain-containing protein, partial [Lachnospiraceae bacterium]|nr:ACT domain-containing protein [Lachnospiraceae bacterium]